MIRHSLEERNEAPPKDYDVILDRISHELYLYRAYCKVAALSGTYVINNPFWFCADDKFFGYSLAKHLNVPVPKTLILPSKSYPSALTPYSFRNLVYPMDWEAVFAEIGFPAFLKPHTGSGWAYVTKVHNPDEFFRAYDQSGELVMMLQQGIEFEQFVRCLIIGQRHVLPIRFDPHQRRYYEDDNFCSASVRDSIVQYARTLTTALGYDTNSAEFAIKDGIPYAIDFTNPCPDFDPSSITQPYFDWAIERLVETIVEVADRSREAAPARSWRALIGPDFSPNPTA